MKPQKNYDSLHHLRTLCTNRMSFDTKLFMFSLSKTSLPAWVGAFLLLMEYTQLFAQSILLNNYFTNTSKYDFSSLYHNIAPIAKVFLPGYFYSPDENNEFPVALLIFLLLYILAKILLLLYVCLIAKKGIKGNNILVCLWRWFFKLHGRILYLFFISFWVNIAVLASQERYDPINIGSAGTMSIAIAVIIIEYLMSLFIYSRYAYLLPTKSFLASKDTKQELIILTQKFVLQIIEIALAGNNLASGMVFGSINLFCSLVGLVYYFKVLPLYNIKALILEGSLIIEATLLNILFLIRHIINLAEGVQVTMDTPLLLGILLTPFAGKLSYTYMNQVIVNLVMNPKEDSPELLMHRISAIKQIRKQQKPPTQYSPANEWLYLIHSSYRTKILSILKLDEDLFPQDLTEIDSKQTANKIFLAYLERLAGQFPKNTLIKLYLAYYYGKKIKAYGTAVKILFGLQQSSSSKISISASMLIYETQKTLMKEYESSQSALNMATYISSLAAVTQLKEKILEQAEIQIKICREFNENAPDLAKIFNHSQRVGVIRSGLEKRMKEVLEVLPEYNLEPQVLFGRYHLVLNHSIMDYLRHAKAFTKLCQRYAKQLSENILYQETLYLRENAFLMITTQSGNSGVVTYCSKSAEKIYGNNLAGGLAYSIAPPVLQNFFFDFFKNPLDKKNEEFFGKIFRTFGYQRSGHLVETDFYINIHPFLSQGLFYNLIIRPVRSNKEFIILNDIGGIEAFTKDIGDKLGLVAPTDASVRGSMSVSQISKDLWRISDAASMVAAKEERSTHRSFRSHRSNRSNKSFKAKADYHKSFKTETEDGFVPEEIEADQTLLNIDDAQQLYTVFNTEGKQLDFTPVKAFGAMNPFIYHCKIANQFYGSTYLKIVTLEEAELDDEIFMQAKTLIWKSTGPAKEGVKSIMTKLTDNAKEKHLPPEVEKITIIEKMEKMDKMESMSPEYLMMNSGINKNFQTMESQASGFLQDGFLNVGEEHPSRVMDPNKNMTSMEFPTASGRKISVLKPSDSKVKSDSSKVMEVENQKRNLKVAMEERWDQDEKNAVAKLEIAQQSLGSQKSRSSAQGRVSKALNEALSINYSPRYYNVFILVFYCLLFGIFGCQLALKLTLDNDINGRSEEKDMIRSSETRNDLLATIQRVLRYTQDVGSGRRTKEQLGLMGKTVQEYIADTISNLQYLGSLNNKLILATKGLSTEFREELFGRNVKVYSTFFGETPEVYILLNNFQATERIIESGMNGADFASTNLTAAMPYFNFIYRNALNDFLLKCDEISDIFLKSLDQAKDATLENLVYILCGTMVVFALIVVISAVVVSMQYDMEKKNMIAFIKLSPHRVREVLEGMLQFKKVIQEDSNFEEVSNADISKFMKISNAKNESGSKKAKQAYTIQHFDIRGIFRKYLFYQLNLIFLMLVMGAFTALIFIIATDKIEGLHMQLHQIQYSDRLSARTNLAVLISQEMLTKGNTTLMKNLPAPEEINIAIEDIQVLRKELAYAFQAEGTTYESVVQGIIYSDACPFLDGIYAESCEISKQGAGQFSLMSAASMLEAGLTLRRDLYATSSSNSTALTQIQLSTFNQTVYSNNVINSATTVISVLIENYYESQLVKTREQSDLVFGISCGVLVVVGILAWFSILQKIREADGKFKKVLQTLPPNLILSNFVLKSYLLKTSRGALDFVKNDI